MAVRREEGIRWLDLGSERFIPTGPMHEAHLDADHELRDNPVRRVSRSNDWVVVIIGLSDRHGTPLPDPRAVERRFIELRSEQIADPGATFRYQEGLFGGYREASVAV